MGAGRMGSGNWGHGPGYTPRGYPAFVLDDSGDDLALEVAANRANWNARVPIHEGSAFYDLEGFVSSRQPRLDAVELDEVGDVAGKRLLHLQCHIGVDTLSWALQGAHVTGLDFSAPALSVARGLAKSMDLTAEFVEADVHGADLRQEFDVVFASHGVLCWVGDIRSWARTAARHLSSGGFLYLYDGHPFADVFRQEDRSDTQLVLDPRYTYFATEPDRSEWSGTYADPKSEISSPETFQWLHTLSEIIQAVRDAGLTIDFVHEFPFDVWKRFPFMVKDGPWWRIEGDPIPLTFSLKAYKP